MRFSVLVVFFLALFGFSSFSASAQEQKFISLDEVVDADSACLYYEQEQETFSKMVNAWTQATSVAASAAIALQNAEYAKTNTPISNPVYKTISDGVRQANSVFNKATQEKQRASNNVGAASRRVEGSQLLLIAFSGGVCDGELKVTREDIKQLAE